MEGDFGNRYISVKSAKRTFCASTFGVLKFFSLLISNAFRKAIRSVTQPFSTAWLRPSTAFPFLRLEIQGISSFQF